MRLAGELAALGTAVCWAGGSNLFAAAGRRIGSRTLNRLRLTIALGFLAAALFAVRGTPWPVWATGMQVALLAASGLVGFVFGDAYYFRALVILGPGRAMLFTTLTPLFTAVLGWPFLGEVPGWVAALGMALTIAGIFTVMRDRAGPKPIHVEGSTLVGVVSGVLGSLGQAGGSILSKLALRTGIDPLSGTLIRAAAGVLALWLVGFANGGAARTVAAVRDRRATMFAVGGAFLGPFLGVTLSLTALVYIQAGIAASIIAISPVITILLAARFHHERLTARTLAGALVAVAGVVVLFLRAG